MLINQRLYPHPVLSWFSDDYPERMFQPAIDVKPNKSFFRIIMNCNTSSKALRDLIDQKKAAYCIHIECSSTRYRSAHKSFDNEFEVDIPVSDLEGKVEVSRFIISVDTIHNFSTNEFHDDFSGRSFDLIVGDVLAVAETAAFPAIKKDDELAELPSIFSIVPSLDEDPPPFDVSIIGNKIVITLSSRTHQIFMGLNSSSDARATLCTMILIPALVYTLNEVRSHPTISDLFDRRWFRVLRKRFEDIQVDIMQLSNNSDSDLVIAGKLIEDPIIKAFDDLESMLIGIGEDDE